MFYLIWLPGQNVINAIIYLWTSAIYLFMLHTLSLSFPSKILPALKFNDSIITSYSSFFKVSLFHIHYSFYIFRNVRQFILTKYSQIVSYTKNVHDSNFDSNKPSWINLLQQRIPVRQINTIICYCFPKYSS